MLANTPAPDDLLPHLERPFEMLRSDESGPPALAAEKKPAAEFDIFIRKGIKGTTGTNGLLVDERADRHGSER